MSVSPSVLYNRLTWAELDGTLAPDCRDVLQAERFRLGQALATHDARAIRAAADEAVRVAAMWGVGL